LYKIAATYQYNRIRIYYKKGDTMANAIYNSFKKDVISGAIDLDTDTLKVMLVTSAYVPNIDTHTKRSDITNEVSGTGYTAGGATLTTPTVSQDNTNDLAKFDADDITWSTSTITARGAVIYKSRGGASSADELVAYIDFGSDKVSSSGDFIIQWSANGILRLS
jgi:malate/lactate dehydrogenase